MRLDGRDQSGRLNAVARSIESFFLGDFPTVNQILHTAHNELHAQLSDQVIPELHGLREIVTRIDVYERHGDARRSKRLPREVGHTDAVLSTAEQDGRPFELCGHLPQYVNSFGLELIEMAQVVLTAHLFLLSCPDLP